MSDAHLGPSALFSFATASGGESLSGKKASLRSDKGTQHGELKCFEQA